MIGRWCPETFMVGICIGYTDFRLQIPGTSTQVLKAAAAAAVWTVMT